MALKSLSCADVLLSNYSLTHPVLKLAECTSWFVANVLHVPPTAYKLHSPSDLIYS